MERLTKRISGFVHGIEFIPGKGKGEMYCRGKFDATLCIDKLASYEETNLTPIEIKKLLDETILSITENTQLKSENAQLKAERDAAVKDLKYVVKRDLGICDVCLNKRTTSICSSCLYKPKSPKWQWRGLGDNNATK